MKYRNKFGSIFYLLIGVVLWFFIFLPLKFISPYLYKIFFQTKYYKLKEDIYKDENNAIKNEWFSFMRQHNVLEDYQNDCIETLEYFSKFDSKVIFSAKKENSQYMNIEYCFHIISLAKEAIQHLEEVTAEDKKVAYYESNKKASLDTLIQHYKNRLNAKNEDKLLTRVAKNEVRLRKFIVKLKKHDSLFINFYLMFFTIFPMENILTKQKSTEDLELFQDLFEFFRIGHATKNQIYKSIAIQLYDIYKPNISKVDLPSNTTDVKLKEEIGKLINFVFQTEKVFTN